MPSIIKDKFIKDQNIVIDYNDLRVNIDIYDTSLGYRFLDALRDNLAKQRILEKNFCFLGFADSKRDLRYLVTELNKNIQQINLFNFQPAYQHIQPFVEDDLQYSSNLPIGKAVNGDASVTPGKRLKHEACNLLHRYFEDLQGTAWKISDYYKQADNETKYAIRQLNNICHEIESWVNADRKKAIEPEWIRPSQITTYLNAPRQTLHNEDFLLFQKNRYDRELGGVYLHWSQVGKTLYEVFRDEDAPQMDDAMCSTINHQKYYSGEFDIEWGQTIVENTFDWKKKEIGQYKKWLSDNGYDWGDPELSLGYIKLGQVRLEDINPNGEFLQIYDKNMYFLKIYDVMKNHLNISSITVTGKQTITADYPYTLDSDDWKKIQIENLRQGYESRSLR